MVEHPKRKTDAIDEEEPLASPTELAGNAEGAIAAEFAARDAVDAAAAEADEPAEESDTLPLEGE